MKRIGLVKKRILTLDLLYEACDYLCREEKRSKWTPATRRAWYQVFINKDRILRDLYEKLQNQTYVFGPFKTFERYESKKVRTIYASYPLDQIVDYVFTKCLEYVFMKKKHLIHPHAYGSIKGKGQHEVRKKVMEAVNKKDRIYVALLDTYHYYPTIDHAIMMKILRKHIKDEWLLWLAEMTITRLPGKKGIALGLASSNILGHVYHSQVDWDMSMSCGRKVKYYRFCDDKIMIGRDKKLLHRLVKKLRRKIKNNLNQEVKKTWRVTKVTHKVRFEFLGSLISTRDARLSSYKRRRIERKFKKEEKKDFTYKVDSDRVIRTWAGIRGSFKNLEVRNLIVHWAYFQYNEFFRRLLLAQCYIISGRTLEINTRDFVLGPPTNPTNLKIGKDVYGYYWNKETNRKGHRRSSNKTLKK